MRSFHCDLLKNCSKMKFLINQILAIFKYLPVIHSYVNNHFLIPRIQKDNIQKDLLSFALLRNKGFVALLVTFISAILCQLGLDTVFGDFLEN